MKAEEKKAGFEGALKRLESLVKEMESGKLGLEEMISRFEEGQKLVDFCAAKLDEVEKKIEVIMKKEGRIVSEDFEPESGKDGDSEEQGERDLF